MIQTGVHVSELTGLRTCDIHLGTGAHIRVTGKGRKKRATTLTGETAKVMRQWLTERHGQPADPLFPTRRGQPLSRYTVGALVAKHAATAAASCPSLKAGRVTPHTLRHTNAMLLGPKAWTSRLSHYGWAMRAPRPRIFTSTPTRRSRNKRSRGRHPSGPNPADTGLPTCFSPSSRACDYVEHLTAVTHAEQGKRGPLRTRPT
jgi:hypothetical protein